MKLICVYSKSHQKLKDDWFLPSIKDEYNIEFNKFENSGSGSYRSKDWSEAVQYKSQIIIKSIKENWGKCFVYSDVDIQFFSPTIKYIEKAIAGKDIVCQKDTPNGTLCTGFFVIRANENTLRLWERTLDAVKIEGRDQLAFNRIVRNTPELKYGILPKNFFSPGTFIPEVWKKGNKIFIPGKPVLFHANFTNSVDDKLKLHEYVKKVSDSNEACRRKNNLSVFIKLLKAQKNISAKKISDISLNYYYKRTPRKVCLDASTLCQLKCKSCPNHSEKFKKNIGQGYLKYKDFKKFVDRNKKIKAIELSNWGEIFLNPELDSILKYAYQKKIKLSANNGVNFNNVSDKVIEALVKYKFRSLTISIDGATSETYSKYRAGGNFDRVISNINELVLVKTRYNSAFPTLKWQYIAFEHNKHEIKKARSLAAELGIAFYLKLSWDDLYQDSFSPVSNSEIVKQETGLGVSNREEYYQKYKKEYIAPTCLQLWNNPRINFDGKLLGCSVNYWDDYGNVFKHDLKSLLTSEKYEYAKKMLQGIAPERNDIPCADCPVYRKMRERGYWIKPTLTNKYIKTFKSLSKNKRSLI